MLNSKSVGIALAAAVAVIGAYLFLQAQEETKSTVHLSVDSKDIVPPGVVRGIASCTPEADVEVTAEIDGVSLEGFPDDSMDGPVNVFEIPTTPEMSGKTIIVTATAADGTRVQTSVKVH